MAAGPDDGPSSTESRWLIPPLSTPGRWLLLTGNRLLLTAIFLLGVYLLVLTSPLAGDIDRERLAPLNYLFAGLLGGNFTLLTIVISVTQLIISRQLGTPGELREQIEATNAYRERIEEAVDVEVTPVTPTEFLHLLLRCSRESLDTARTEAQNVDDGDARDALLDVVSDVESHIEQVESLVAREGVGLFEALAATLDTNYSRDIYRLRQLRTSWSDTHSETTLERLDDLVVRLQQIDVARQYLKTLYMQDELSRLSLHLLYVGVPAVVVSAFMLRMFAVTVQTLPSTTVTAAVPVAITVGFAPLGVLVAYVLRLATVARRTVAITPFTVSSQERRRPAAAIDRGPGHD